MNNFFLKRIGVQHFAAITFKTTFSIGTKTGKGGVDTLRLHLEPFLQRKWKSFQHHGIKMLYGKGLTNITIFEH